jgi:hypothetical protein
VHVAKKRSRHIALRCGGFTVSMFSSGGLGFSWKEWTAHVTAASPRSVCSLCPTKMWEVHRTGSGCCGAMHLRKPNDADTYKRFAAMRLLFFQTYSKT